MCLDDRKNKFVSGNWSLANMSTVVQMGLNDTLVQICHWYCRKFVTGKGTNWSLGTGHW